MELFGNLGDGFARELAQLFVHGLPVGPFFGGEHENIFHRKMGDLRFEMGERKGAVDGEVGEEMREEVEDGVGAKERFGDGEAAVRGVVKGALEPLGRCRIGGVLRERDDESGQSADSLRIDGITFIGHGRGADLSFGGSFGEFSFMGEEADISSHFVGGGGKRFEGVEDVEVEFSRIGLTCNGEDLCKAEVGGNEGFELFDFGGIVVEEGEEGGLGAGSAFGAEEGERCDVPFEFLGVEEEVLEPEAGAFADGGWLRGLEVRVGKAGGSCFRFCEAREEAQDVDEFVEEQLEGFSKLDKVGVIGDIGRGGAEVDDRLGFGALVAKCVDMGHYVMAKPFFVLGGGGKVDFVDVIFELGDLLVGNREAEFLLRFCKRSPKAAERGNFILGGEEAGHLRTCIARREGRGVFFVARHGFTFQSAIALARAGF